MAVDFSRCKTCGASEKHVNPAIILKASVRPIGILCFLGLLGGEEWMNPFLSGFGFLTSIGLSALAEFMQLDTDAATEQGGE